MKNDKQKDRLVELLNRKYDHFCDQCGVNKDSHYTDNLADYLLANGVIVPPCKVGQTVYRVVVMSTGVTRVFKKTLCPPYECGVIVDCKPTIKRFIRSVIVTKNNFLDVVENWGKTVFPTREEAVEALKGGVQG